MSRAHAQAVAVLASRVRREERWLLEALDHRGIPTVQLDPRRLALGVAPPDGLRGHVVLNREISLSRAAHVAQTLRAWQLPAVNDAAAIEVCGNKWTTALMLHDHGVPTPKTWLALSPDGALEIMEDLGLPLVVKPVHGSWGRRVALLPDARTAEVVVEHIAALPAPVDHLLLIQEVVHRPIRELRVIVVGGTSIGAIQRSGTDWRRNSARGSVARAVRAPGPESVAVAAATAVGAAVAGVDVIEDSDGAPMVLDVNHGVEFAAFQTAWGDEVDVAGRIIDHVTREFVR